MYDVEVAVAVYEGIGCPRMVTSGGPYVVWTGGAVGGISKDDPVTGVAVGYEPVLLIGSLGTPPG